MQEKFAQAGGSRGAREDHLMRSGLRCSRERYSGSVTLLAAILVADMVACSIKEGLWRGM